MTNYTWEITVRIYWPGGAKSVRSLSHPDTCLVNQQPGMITATFNPAYGAQYPEKDFELCIEDQSLFTNSCIVAEADLPTITGQSPRYAAMLQFVPSMNKWYADKGTNDEQGVDIYSLDNNDFLLENTMAEFIFIIDRSGSMGGKRIENAKRALRFFLKSLPFNSTFNIISFGSSFSLMFPQSVPYNTQNMNIALNQINSFSANMGGTEILQPITSAFNLPRLPYYQRNIFLLTDGSVSNVNNVISSIEVNCIYNSARVF